ncbi:MAG: UDP-N-acetylglucosamine 2-epimerase (non-hydrolyzing) [Deltaproteobacteria bacterium]|nr:UDP-N-acetylglucosamine 2-epimerase (non-hydrolyzing) [Deltaproteobacteria bacterium]
MPSEVSKRFLHVVGARPNFMKAAPVLAALAGRAEQTLVHTGQHYDAAMSEVFFDQLGLPAPDVDLEVGSGSHAAQTAQIMTRFEPVLLERRPDFVVVYGDVNSTVAATLVASKLLVRVAHVEAGLRSRDRKMPEEINRLVTDTLADLLFTPSTDGDDNLRAEGVAADKIHFVGNVMIDTLVRLLPAAAALGTRARLGLPRPYVLVTLHRPSNVDDPATLAPLLAALGRAAASHDVVFPVHPRTRGRLAESGVAVPERIRLLEPLGYLEFLDLQREAAAVITDSGGIQEESTFLGVPCITVRENTERPVTVTLGTNVLVGRDPLRMLAELERALEGGTGGRATGAVRPPLWDGRAAERIAPILLERA